MMNSKGKKCAVLTTFYSWDEAYSLVTVVRNQLTVLLKYGYQPVLFVLPSFNDDSKIPEGVEIRKVIPQCILEPYHKHIFDSNIEVPENFEEDVEKVAKALEEHCQDIDIAITHDWILVDDFVVYGTAIKKANLPRIKWLNWIHSVPSPRPAEIKYPWDCQYTVMPHSKIVFLNNFDVIRVAERYGGEVDDVRVVHNPIDLRTFFNPQPLVQNMIDHFDLLSADFVQVYPLSTPRMVDNKQVDKVIKIFGKLKEHGKSVCLIVCNAHANGDKEKELVVSMKQLASKCGLDPAKEVIFTSMINPPENELGISHEVVKDLFLLSNLFIFPSVSENCPLILLEAASARCLLVLNDDFAPLRDFFGKDALYFKFSSSRVKTEYAGGEDNYYDDVAKIIIGEANRNKPLQAFNTLRQKFNFDSIFREQLEPLLMEDF